MRKVVIRSTDFWGAGHIRQASLRFGPLELSPGIGIGRCTFETKPGVVLPFLPREFDYVEVTDTDGTTLRFTGRIRQVTRERVLGVRENATNPGSSQGSYWTIDCQDWAAELDRINVTSDISVAAGANDKYIVESQVITPYWGQIATTGLSHTVYARRMNMPAVSITQGSRSVRGALNAIAEAAYNSKGYVDPSKQLHWNDVLALAPFALDDATPVGATGNFRGYSRMIDYLDLTAVAHRVTVIGTGGNDTVTDFPGFFRYNRQRTYERGSPNLRVLQLDDITDMALTTSEQRIARGFQELAAVAERWVLTVTMYDSGLYPGMLVDVFDRDVGTYAVPYAMSGEEPMAHSNYGRTVMSLGRFQVQRVTPTPRGAENWEYECELGAYLPTFEQVVAA